jgi:hypothetical protein
MPQPNGKRLSETDVNQLSESLLARQERVADSQGQDQESVEPVDIDTWENEGGRLGADRLVRPLPSPMADERQLLDHRPKERTSMTRQYCRMAAKALKISANGRLDLGPEEERRQLARSYIKCPIHPIIANREGLIADGNRRISGLMLLGEGDREVDVILTDEPFTPDTLNEYGLLSAVHKKDLGPYEKAMAMQTIRAAHPEWTTTKQLADYLATDPSMCLRFLALFQTIEPVQAAAREGKLGVAAWYSISKAAPADQQALLDLTLAGASRDAVESQVRKRRTANKPVVKADRIKIQLSRLTVTISGSGLTLDDAIEATAEAQKELKKGRDQGLTAKTISRISAERSKAGG